MDADKKAEVMEEVEDEKRMEGHQVLTAEDTETAAAEADVELLPKSVPMINDIAVTKLTMPSYDRDLPTNRDFAEETIAPAAKRRRIQQTLEDVAQVEADVARIAEELLEEEDAKNARVMVAIEADGDIDHLVSQKLLRIQFVVCQLVWYLTTNLTKSQTLHIISN